jgi:hypothetical protein
MRLSIEVESELRKKVKIAATEREMSMGDYVVGILEAVTAAEARGEGNGGSSDLAPPRGFRQRLGLRRGFGV